MVDIELGNMEIHIGHVIMFFSALKRFFDCTWSSAWFGGSILPVASAFWVSERHVALLRLVTYFFFR
jgi:hypothetical protein